MQDSPQNFYKKFLGNLGEKLAVKYLKKLRYKILEKNYTTHIGEIDIIAEEKGELVFIEVKTRSSDNYGKPSEAVDRNKQRKYYLVAEEYLIRNNATERECRFDVIEVENNEINHIKNAFM